MRRWFTTTFRYIEQKRVLERNDGHDSKNHFVLFGFSLRTKNFMTSSTTQTGADTATTSFHSSYVSGEILTSLPRKVYLSVCEGGVRQVKASATRYMTRKCWEKETTIARMSHLLTQGLTTNSDSLSDNALRALNISTVTRMDRDLRAASQRESRGKHFKSR